MKNKPTGEESMELKLVLLTPRSDRNYINLVGNPDGNTEIGLRKITDRFSEIDEVPLTSFPKEKYQLARASHGFTLSRTVLQQSTGREAKEIFYCLFSFPAGLSPEIFELCIDTSARFLCRYFNEDFFVITHGKAILWNDHLVELEDKLKTILAESVTPVTNPMEMQPVDNEIVPVNTVEAGPVDPAEMSLSNSETAPSLPSDITEPQCNTTRRNLLYSVIILFILLAAFMTFGLFFFSVPHRTDSKQDISGNQAEPTAISTSPNIEADSESRSPETPLDTEKADSVLTDPVLTAPVLAGLDPVLFHKSLIYLSKMLDLNRRFGCCPVISRLDVIEIQTTQKPASRFVEKDVEYAKQTLTILIAFQKENLPWDKKYWIEEGRNTFELSSREKNGLNKLRNEINSRKNEEKHQDREFWKYAAEWVETVEKMIPR